MAGIAIVLDQQGTSPNSSCQTLHSRGLFSASLAASTAADLLAAATPASTALFGSLHKQDHVCESSENQAELRGATSTERPPSWWIMCNQKPWQNIQLP